MYRPVERPNDERTPQGKKSATLTKIASFGDIIGRAGDIYEGLGMDYSTNTYKL